MHRSGIAFTRSQSMASGDNFSALDLPAWGWRTASETDQVGGPRPGATWFPSTPHPLTVLLLVCFLTSLLPYLLTETDQVGGLGPSRTVPSTPHPNLTVLLLVCLLPSFLTYLLTETDQAAEDRAARLAERDRVALAGVSLFWMRRDNALRKTLYGIVTNKWWVCVLHKALYDIVANTRRVLMIGSWRCMCAHL